MILKKTYGTFSGSGLIESAISSIDFTAPIKDTTDLLVEIDNYEEDKRAIITWQYAIKNNYLTPFHCYCKQYFSITNFNSNPETNNLEEVILSSFNRFALECNLKLTQYEIPKIIEPITNASEVYDKAVQQLLGVLLPLLEDEKKS